MLRMLRYANTRKYKCTPGLLCKLCCRCKWIAGIDPIFIIHCVYCGEEFLQRQMPHSACMCVYIVCAWICVYRPGELCAHSAAEPERALCSLPGLSCLVCRWSMRKGIGWSGVSVINLVINSYRSRVKQRAVRWKWHYKKEWETMTSGVSTMLKWRKTTNPYKHYTSCFEVDFSIKGEYVRSELAKAVK